MDPTNFHPIIIAAGKGIRLAELTRDKPKVFLPIHGRTMLEYHFDILCDRGFRQVTVVVGYMKELVMKGIGSRYKSLSVEYVVSKEYAVTGHGWSIFLTREPWHAHKRPVILIHADIFYHPHILDKVIEMSHDNVVAVDGLFEIITGDEVVVYGQDGLVAGFRYGATPASQQPAGELVGINKWSPDFMKDFYDFMESYFRRFGKDYNYEPVLDTFLKESSHSLYYVATDGLEWININYKEDYQKAVDRLYPKIYHP